MPSSLNAHRTLAIVDQLPCKRAEGDVESRMAELAENMEIIMKTHSYCEVCSYS
jgi:hypothetical protein